MLCPLRRSSAFLRRNLRSSCCCSLTTGGLWLRDGRVRRSVAGRQVHATWSELATRLETKARSVTGSPVTSTSDPAQRPGPRRARRVPRRQAGGVRRSAGARPEARPDPRQAVERPARPVRAAAASPDDHQGPAAGVDVRNYGGLEGLTELREIFAELLWVDVDQVICQGNSSLSLMHQAITCLMLSGGPDSERPWSRTSRSSSSSARSPATTGTSRCWPTSASRW